MDEDIEEDAGISVITALKWIPRSYLLEKPVMYELSKDELEQIQAEQEQGNYDTKKKDGESMEAEDDGEGEKNVGAGNEDDDQINNEEDLPLSQLQDMHLNEDRLAREDEDEESDLGSDVEDHCYKIMDKVLVTATVEDEQASLEIHTYDTETGSFYVHHDIALPSYPLCIEWVGVKGKELGWTQTESQGFLAVGTFLPHIEIWSMDVLDALEPNAKLEGHKDAVMCLAWNQSLPNLLASGGADCAVKIWDLQTSKCGRSFDKVHKDKVQSAQWNPAEGTVLLTGSFDRSVAVFDARNPEKVAKYSIGDSDVECVTWDVHNPALFGVSTENGVVSFMDVRMGPSAAPLISFQAHEKACSTLCGNSRVPGLYATCSADKTVKLWDLQEDLTGRPSEAQSSKTRKSKKPSFALKEKIPVATRKMKVGKLFGLHFAANVDDDAEDFPAGSAAADPFLLACGGDKGAVALWHAGSVEEDEEDARFKQVFSERILPSRKSWT